MYHMILNSTDSQSTNRGRVMANSCERLDTTHERGRDTRGGRKVIMDHCPACYSVRRFCRRCKTTHCQCSYRQCANPRRVVVHASRVSHRGNTTITGTLCGRMRTMDDGMNVGSGVTCKFCLKLQAGTRGEGK